MNENHLPAATVGPDDAPRVVIWLHGLGADGYDFHPIVPELGLPAESPVRFVFPHAPPRPVTLNGGMVMRAWYDIAELSLEARSQDEEGIRASAAQVNALIEREEARGVASEDIVLAGFSQGGALATYTALRYPRRLAGLVALSCYMLMPEALADEASDANRQLPVLMAHGVSDPVVPLMAGEHARDALRGAGYPVEWETYPVPHAVHMAEITRVGAWLIERLGL